MVKLKNSEHKVAFSAMQIITLTTDNGYQDYYVAAIKGKLFQTFPTAHVIDISHSITPFDVKQAAFQLRCCYDEFPAGTIHIVGVDTEPQFEGQKTKSRERKKIRISFKATNSK